jgi:hypothetical protein
MKLAVLSSAAAIAIYAGASATQSRAPTLDESATAEYVPSIPLSTLRESMRRLWTEHAVFTHSYIVASGAGAPEAVPILNRLMRNQEEIGSALGEFYGKPVAERSTQLLKQHIAQAGDLYKAMRNADTARVKEVHKLWHENADAIADYLALANPHWKRDDLRAMMSRHLELVTDQVKARIKRDWEADLTAYDAGYGHILAMADAMAGGIAKQFPAKVTADEK